MFRKWEKRTKRSVDRLTWQAGRLEQRIMLDGEASDVAVASGPAIVEPLDTTANVRVDSPQLVFIDTGVEDIAALTQGIDANAELILLDANAGLEQITQTLATRINVSAVHLVTHGADGAIHLGNERVDASTLERHADQVRSWTSALAPGADILLYGCNVAASRRGEAFVGRLAELTNADVAASNDTTGSIKNSADWQLEHHVGHVETDIAFVSTVRVQYNGTLATVNFDNLPTGSQGNSFVSGGLRFTDGGWQQEDLGIFGTANGYASNVLQPLRYGRTLTIERANGSAFDLTSFDYAAGRFSTTDATVTGFRSDGSTVTSSFASSSKSLQTLTLNWNDVTEVVIDFRTGSNQVFGSIDNVTYDEGNVTDATISMVTASQSVSEGVGNATINVSRSGNTASAVSVGYQTQSGTAVAGQDFSAQTGTLNFAAGQTTASISVPITDDANPESSEAFTVVLQNPSAGAILGTSSTIVNIADNDSPGGGTVIDFQNLSVGNQGPALTVDGFRFEDVGVGNSDLLVYGPEAGYSSRVLHSENWNRTIRMTQENGQPFDLSSFDFAAGRWNTLTDATVTGTTAGGGTQSQTFSTSSKTLQTLNLGWTNLTSVDINFAGGATNAYGAVDNFNVGGGTGNPSTISLATSLYDVNEGNGSVVVTVERAGSTSGTASVDYATINATAIAGADYTNTNGTLTFGPGVTTRTFSVPILNDSDQESNETFTVTIDNVTGNASLLAPRTAVVTIIDNDTAYPSYPNFASTNQLSLNGNAAGVGNRLRLTNATNFEVGSAFFQSPIAIDGSTSFETEFQFQITGGQASLGADGLAFVVQGDSAGALGAGANGLGYGGLGNSLAVEFDTYQNAYDPSANHVSILTNGDVETPLQTNAPGLDLNSGSVVNAWVDYNGSTNLMAVYISNSTTKPETPVLLQQVDMAAIVGTQGYVGFTGSTGGFNNVHEILNWDYQPTVPIITPPGSDLTDDVLVVGLNQPTAIDWNDNGQNMLIAQKNGVIRVARNGSLFGTPFIDISAQVNGTRDRGLLDIAVHPDFANNPYVYLLFTYDPPEVNGNSGLAGPDGNGNRAGRMIRVTADAATNYTTAIAGSEVVLLGSNSTWDNFNGFANSTNDFTEPPAGILPDGTNIQDFVASDSESHTVGSVEFGADGALYVSIGDGTSYNAVDPRTVRVQDIDNLSGKILRLDPLTGEGLSDNPFYDGDRNANRSKVYQYGLRNPFRITVDPVTNDVYIGDVGWGTWEEVNRAAPGANFGWPYYEGGSGTSNRSGYQNLPEAQAFYASGQTVDASIFALSHAADGINAIVMGDVYRGTTYPTEFLGDVFVNDLGQGIVRNISFDASGNVSDVDIFTTGASAYVQIVQGPDGNLHYVDLGGGRIGRWTFT